MHFIGVVETTKTNKKPFSSIFIHFHHSLIVHCYKFCTSLMSAVLEVLWLLLSTFLFANHAGRKENFNCLANFNVVWLLYWFYLTRCIVIIVIIFSLMILLYSVSSKFRNNVLSEDGSVLTTLSSDVAKPVTLSGTKSGLLWFRALVCYFFEVPSMAKQFSAVAEITSSHTISITMVQ